MIPFEMRAVRPDETKLLYTDNEYEHEQWCIGHLRLDFGRSGNEFWHTWWGHNDELNTPEFKREFDSVINALRDGGPLNNLKEMKSFCNQHQAANLATQTVGASYGFIGETENYRYAFRLTDSGYNGYIYCYDKLEQAIVQESQQSQEPELGM